MPKPKRSRDINERAKNIVDIATGEAYEAKVKDKRDPSAVALGKKGGAARAKSLTPEERSKQAKKAAKKRWANKKKGK